MKTAIFLYPISPYVDALTRRGRTFDPQERGETLERVINLRYRQRGHTVAWALFAHEDDMTAPDRSLLWPFAPIHKEDAIIVAPVSFKRHCQEELYPDPSAMVTALGNISRLAVMGFHSDDCCERLAEAAWRLGIPSKVHDDLSEKFFSFEFFKDPSEEIRARPFWRRVSKQRPSNDAHRRGFRGRRTRDLEAECRQKPWLLQVT